MPGLNDLIQVTAKGTYAGEPWNSTHYYRVTTGSIDPLSMNWIAEQAHIRFRNWSAFAVNDWQLTTVDSINLTNTAEVGTFFGIQQGIRPDADGRTPSGVNLYFKIVRSTTATRNGIRYMNGIPELDVAGNEYVGNISGVRTYANWYAESYGSPNYGAYAPVIVRKQPGGGAVLFNPVRSAVYRGLTVMNRRMP